MTIERAREILQEEIQDLTDEEVLAFISSTGEICDELLEIIIQETLVIDCKIEKEDNED